MRDTRPTDRRLRAEVRNETNRRQHYGGIYKAFESELSAAIRAQAFGEDIGQNSWLTVEEHDLFISWLCLGATSRLLDIGCGSGGPTLRLAVQTGCWVHGIDVDPLAVATARARAAASDVVDRTVFECVDATARLPFEACGFDALLCVDVISHLPDRGRVLADWARVLAPGGRLVFTDPVVLSGPVTSEEIAIRSSIGFLLFVPPGADEGWITEAGLEIVATEDRTQNMARVARGRRRARAAHAAELRRLEGDRVFEHEQQFFEVAARLASEARLSRIAWCARKPDPR